MVSLVYESEKYNIITNLIGGEFAGGEMTSYPICDCPILFAFYNVGKVSYKWSGVRAVELNTEN